MNPLTRNVLNAASIVGLVQGQPFLCDIPISGCTNGVFNQALCECHCIPPFCADTNGDCTTPSNDCGDVKWKGCKKGMDCPWWVNFLRAESCTTGPDVPVGIWNIYNTREACCKTNFANSDSCDIKLGSGDDRPTRHPTIAAPEESAYEIIPIKFDVGGVPNNTSMRKLKDEMKTVLKRILLRLAKSIPELKISAVEEKLVAMYQSSEEALSASQKDVVSLYFNVYAVRDDDREFGPLIVTEIQDSYDEVLDQIHSMSDTSYFGGDLNLNFCTTQDGKFELCAGKTPENPPRPETVDVPAPKPATVDVPAPSPMTIRSYPTNGKDDAGLPIWAIALIVAFSVLVLCCIGAVVFVRCYKDGHDDTKEIHNNIYMGDKKRQGFSYPPRSSSSNRRSHQFRYLADPQLSKPDGDPSASTTPIRPKRMPDRDLIKYNPSQEHKPASDAAVLMIKNGKNSFRYYEEDLPRKPKRDPTMYVKGKFSRDPTMYVEGQRDPSMYVEGQRDPSMYVEGQRDPSMYVEGQRDPSMCVEGKRDPSTYVEGQRDPSMYVEGQRDPPEHVSRFKDARLGLDNVGDGYDEEYYSHGFDHNLVHSESNRKYGRARRNSRASSGSGSSSQDPSFRTGDPSSPSVPVRSKTPKLDKNKQDLRRWTLESNWQDEDSLDDFIFNSDEWGNSLQTVQTVMYTPNAMELKELEDRKSVSFHH